MFGRLRSPKTSTNDDTARLRDALVLVLEHASERVAPAVRQRIDKVVHRLSQSPSPTGLVREMSDLAPRLSSRDSGDDAEISAAISALAAALTAVAMEDRELHGALDELAKSIPRRVDGRSASEVSSRVHTVSSLANSVRARLSRGREATVALVQSLVTGIGKASSTTGRVDVMAEALARSVVELHDVDGMSELAKRMQGHVDGIRVEVMCLRRDLAASTSAAMGLQARLDRPQAQPEDTGWESDLRAHLARSGNR